MFKLKNEFSLFVTESKSDLADWLNKKGMITWFANWFIWWIAIIVIELHLQLQSFPENVLKAHDKMYAF